MSYDPQGDSAQVTTTFTFDSLVVRTLMRNGEIWFFAADVCAALEIANPSKAISRLDEDERMTLTSSEGQNEDRGMTLDTVEGQSDGSITSRRGGARFFSLVNESGLYTLILTSRKEEAKRFKRWVTHDVLPTLRRTGTYSVPGRTNQPTIGNQTQSWRLIDRLKRENDRDLRRLYYAQLQSVLAEQGLPTPPLSSMGADAPEEPPAVRVLWEAVAALEAMGVRLNHSRDPALVAINPRHLTAAALDHGVRLMGRGDLMRAMRLSQKPRFLDVRVVNSAIRENSVRCWVFDQASVPAPSADTIDIV